MKERQAKSGPPGSSGVASLSGTVHVSRNLSSIRRSAQRLELQAEDKVSQVAMALVSEAEVDENRGVCAVSVTQPISGTGPSFKEPSQKTAVVAAPAAELPDKIGPEASNITNEQAGKQRKLAALVPYKSSMGLLSVESDSEYMRAPKASGAAVKQGKQGDAQEEIPKLQEPMRNNVGQADAFSSGNSPKSAESVMKVAQHAAPCVYKVEGKAYRTKGSGKKTSLTGLQA
ncbi:hypothetical protein MRX96_010746 [Rhipicephalus microplus]